MAGEKGNEESARMLEQTPTWAVAGVCFVIILVSIALEKVLQKVGTWLTDRHKKALNEALEKVKAELMILGFISLTLVFCQYYIAGICIPIHVANTMLPCPLKVANDKAKEGNHRRLSSHGVAGKDFECPEGRVALISEEGLHDIHILVFFLAVFHVIYSAATMALGKLKIRGWRHWEQETSTHDDVFSNDPSRFRFSHDTSFVRAHTSFWTRIPFFFYIGCFFRQFFKSVSKSDYLTLRNGFIATHLAPGSKFNFQKYIRRSLEDDFKTVVGVSPVLWGSFVLFLLLNVSGWRFLLSSASLIPLVIILAVGTKLQAILTTMALEITERDAVVQGIPVVQASDNFFWFGRPRLLLDLIHFALFQNAFQVTYFLWLWLDQDVCMHENLNLVIAKIALGVGVVCLCSYSTLPLYALITQMGSHMKKSIFDEQTSKALKKWHMAAVKKKVGRGRPPTLTLGGGGGVGPTSSMGSPSQLHRFKTARHSAQSSGYNHDHDESDLEDPCTPLAPTARSIMRTNHDDHVDDSGNEMELETRNEEDLSFAKPAPRQE